MKRLLTSLKERAFLLCLLLIMTGVVFSQGSNDPAKHFYDTTKAAPAAFKAGNMDQAKLLSLDLMEQAQSWKENWNYGNAIHAANLVLGRIALNKGEIEAAKHYLLEAGNTPGSPQLNSFGPDMVFAKELLEKGERETVIKYFNLCSKFWDKRFSKIAQWNVIVANGDIPDFEANLRYFF